MEKDLVTIIVPVYKVEKYLNKCVESIVKQTYKNLEIILVDDGSPDKCPELCDEWVNKDDRIKVIHKSNGGLSSARNDGLDRANGSYICFCDSDDYIEPTYVEDLYEALTKNNVDMSVCEMYEINGDNKVITSFEKDYILNVYDTNEFYNAFNFQCIKMISVCNKMYKKNLVKNIRFDGSLKCGEDLMFNCDCYRNVDKIACVNKPLYNYVDNVDSVTRKKLKDVILYHDKLFPSYKQFAADVKNTKILQRLSSNYCQNFVTNLYLIVKIEGKRKAKEFFKQSVKDGGLKHFEEAISCVLVETVSQKIVKFILKRKRFWMYLFLGKLIYKNQQKRQKTHYV